MTSSPGSTRRTERRAWTTQAEHLAVLSRNIDDGYTDKVTHCHNRQYLMEILGPQIEASRKYGFPLSFVLFELSHFRQIRFSFGDPRADKILEELAKLVKTRVRSSDLLVRFDDEKFGLLLLHANRRGSEIVAGRLRELISKHAFAGPTSDAMLSANFGAAEQVADYDENGEDLVANAQKALDSANSKGSGAIVVCGINL